MLSQNLACKIFPTFSRKLIIIHLIMYNIICICIKQMENRIQLQLQVIKDSETWTLRLFLLPWCMWHGQIGQTAICALGMGPPLANTYIRHLSEIRHLAILSHAYWAMQQCITGHPMNQLLTMCSLYVQL